MTDDLPSPLNLDEIPSSEPIVGKTYFADGWVYRFIDLITKEDFKKLIDIIGEDNKVMLALSDHIINGQSWFTGQFLISPEGIENLKRVRAQHE